MRTEHHMAGLSVVAAMLTTATALAATQVDTTETWSGGDAAGWTNSVELSGAHLSNPGGYLNLSFDGTTAPDSVEDTMRMEIGPGMLPEVLTFAIEATDTPPSYAEVVIHTAEHDRSWRLGIAITSINESVLVEARVEFDAGWFWGIGGTEAMFLNDLRSVDWVGVTLTKHAATGEQNYSLDNFRLQGVQFTGDADMDYMADDWEALNGLSSNNYADAGLDDDQDGMSNYAEFRAGTDPQLLSSRFEAEVATIEGVTGIPVELRWDSISNRWYTIRRSTDLTEGFEVLVTGEEATPPTNTFQDVTATNAPAYFYRVEVEPEI